MACDYHYLLFFVWLLWKLINIFYYCDYLTVIHWIPLHNDQSTESNRKTWYHFLKSKCTTELFWNFFFETCKCPGIAILQSSRCVSNEQSCLKTTGLYDDLLLLSSLFHFYISHSVLQFHLVFSFQFLFYCFLKPLSNIVEK